MPAPGEFRARHVERRAEMNRSPDVVGGCVGERSFPEPIQEWLCCSRVKQVAGKVDSQTLRAWHGQRSAERPNGSQEQRRESQIVAVTFPVALLIIVVRVVP